MGNALIVRKGGVGGAGEFATIKAFADAGATVTATLGSKTIQGVYGTYEGETYYKISPIEKYGNWQVTATKDGETVTEEVEVDEATEFSVELHFQIINYALLYDYGDEHTDVTGGWNLFFTQPSSYYTNCALATKTSDRIIGTNSGISSRGLRSAITTNKFSNVYGAFSKAKLTGGNTYHWASVAAVLDTESIDAAKGIVTHSLGSSATFGYIRLNNNQARHYAFYTGFENSSVVTGEMYLCGICYADDISGLSQYGATVDAILANSSQLLSNEDAVKYVAKKCTGDFMLSAVTNTTFKNALNSSPYKNIIEMNEHWSKFLTYAA